MFDSSKLFAVSPEKLSHDAPSSAGRERIERVEFNRQLRSQSIKVFGAVALLLLLWSYLTQIADIAQAQGQLIPAQDVQLMRSAIDGKVTDIKVKEGDAVKKGDLLVTLDTTNFETELQKSEHELKIEQREYERHVRGQRVLVNYLRNPSVALVDLSGVTAVAQSIGQLYAAQKRLTRAEADMKLISRKAGNVSQMGALSFQQRHLKEQSKFKQSALTNRLQQFAIEEKKLSDEIDSLQRQLKLQQLATAQKEASVGISRKQLAAYERAFASGASSKTECLDAKMGVEDKERELTLAQSSQLQTDGAVQSAEHELAQLRSTHSVSKLQMDAGLQDLSANGAQIPMKMRAAERELLEARSAYEVALRTAQSENSNERSEIILRQKSIAELQAEITGQKHILAKCELHAPVDGTIALMHLQGPGQVVQHGETLLTVVPTNEELLVEAYVPNADIGFVHKDQAVRLAFPAYPYQQYGTITGKVVQIDDAPSNDREHDTLYRILVLPQRNWMVCQGQKIWLRKGLDVDTQINLRNRSLLMMQLAPIFKLQYSHFKG